ncbi:MAG TPA: hypothetical protein VJ947_05740, partial [Pseudohaliea sp.]|nr:hypothetical protein [Pseudohaliea sp.]
MQANDLDTALARHGLSFAELQTPEGLTRLDAAFLGTLERADPALAARLRDFRERRNPLPPLAASELLIALGPRLETFVAEAFGIREPLAELNAAILAEDPVFLFKREVVQKRARRRARGPEPDFTELDRWLDEAIAGSTPDRERAVAEYARDLLADEDANAEPLERLTAWCRQVRNDPQAAETVRGWASFQLPEKVDHARLVPLQRSDADGMARLQAEPSRWRRRDGFTLTDARMGQREVQGQVHYCIYCHDHDGDFCSKGFPEKKAAPELGFKADPLGVTLTGCPLEEKISEMHLMRRDGHAIAALAVAMADNPMIPATGHRICNDCMKACIYQKQDPVNIPEIETRSLTDVLGLPWGVEVYHLLARWNPLRRRQYLQSPDNGRRVLVAGLGP